MRFFFAIINAQNILYHNSDHLLTVLTRSLTANYFLLFNLGYRIITARPLPNRTIQNTKSMKLTQLTLIATMVAATSALHAATVTYSDTWGNPSAPVLTLPSGDVVASAAFNSEVISLPQFDPLLGTLTQISLTLRNTRVVIDYTILANAGANRTVGAGGLTATGSIDLIENRGGPGLSFTGSGSTGTFGAFTFVPSGGSFTFEDQVAILSGGITSSAPADLLAYTGAGFVSFNFGPFSPTQGSAQGSGTISGDGGTQLLSGSAGIVDVTYTYDLPPSGVPEPASGLFGLLVTGVLFGARRRSVRS